ncbi:hypothetical protein DDB_G0281897 [Dictyostelium discoideum AX4]|uniref:Putative uncharacterized transmembrane protein DDB_G0281897 n=1 Tax=Dictyostelium discoideum TaxID=44689 RepID=Y4276_DICDI|nr:hypothetical protein DDB_G0281897 [Dictyostelium discoideum AX4]Q54TA2.1 RecName: Full=Putative uncharacterized transmembrane protein DDB_G0281897; Flags: Precursor [Dictyostelium discoideum]EAL66508.1 hypothetical protein DDB_G0281897 [Dictyostelium discoideum AX4]|eukprot:XP_640487.1 hypothetical protein DDB_G0281897 [Dictyostelium discoideum AX4]
MKILYFIFVIIINILLILNHVKSKYNTFIFENTDGFPECNREVPIDKCTLFCGRLFGGLSYDSEKLIFYEGENCYTMIHGEFLCSDTERTSFRMDNYLADDESWYKAFFNYLVNCTWDEKNTPETPSPTENAPNTSGGSSEGNHYTYKSSSSSSEHINDIPTYSHSGYGNYGEDPQRNIGISLSSSLIFISILFLIIFINN